MSVIPDGAVMIVLLKMPAVEMDNGIQTIKNVTAIMDGAVMIVPKWFVAETDIGMIIWGGALVIPAGAAAIVPRIIQMIVASMEVGLNRETTVPAVVPVFPGGAERIVLTVVQEKYATIMGI